MAELYNRETSATVTIQPTTEALEAVVSAWNASLPFVQNIQGLVWAIVMEPLPPAIYARRAATNALGLADRNNKALMVVMLSITWDDADDNERVDKEARSLIRTIEQRLTSLGALDPFTYLNYAASWQKPIYSYGEANVERLLRIQEEYDPHHIFTDYVPGGFKIRD
jgi:hypothetical protein